MKGYIKWYYNHYEIDNSGPILVVVFDKPSKQGYYECSSIDQDGLISRAHGLLVLRGRIITNFRSIKNITFMYHLF